MKQQTIDRLYFVGVGTIAGYYLAAGPVPSQGWDVWAGGLLALATVMFTWIVFCTGLLFAVRKKE